MKKEDIEVYRMFAAALIISAAIMGSISLLLIDLPERMLILAVCTVAWVAGYIARNVTPAHRRGRR